MRVLNRVTHKGAMGRPSSFQIASSAVEALATRRDPRSASRLAGRYSFERSRRRRKSLGAAPRT
jgi:hypothetical protein